MVEAIFEALTHLLAWLIWGDDKHPPRPILIWGLRLISIGGGALLIGLSFLSPQTTLTALLFIWMPPAVITMTGEGYAGSRKIAMSIVALLLAVIFTLYVLT